MKSPTPVLDLLRDPAKWTKGHYARAADGGRADMYSKEAASFCILGAIGRCHVHHAPYNEAVHRVQAQVKPFVSIGAFNDSPLTTHADVVRVLKKAQV